MDDKEFKYWTELFNMLGKAVITHAYENQRDVEFLRAIIGKLSYVSEKEMDKSCRTWNREYDKLNKHLLEEKLKEGELIAPRSSS